MATLLSWVHFSLRPEPLRNTGPALSSILCLVTSFFPFAPFMFLFLLSPTFPCNHKFNCHSYIIHIIRKQIFIDFNVLHFGLNPKAEHS